MPFEQGLHNKFLLWHGVQVTSLASILRDGLKLPPSEALATTYRYGKGIYFTDCASKAVTQAVNTVVKAQTTEITGYLLLCEVALGDMHKVLKPTQFTKAPLYSHSVYGVGQLKPKLYGIKDVNRGLRNQDGDEGNFTPDEMTVCSPNALFFHTGKLGPNT